MFKFLLNTLLVGFAALALTPASASVLLTFTQVGTNVLLTGAGTLDIGKLGFATLWSGAAAVGPSGGPAVFVGPTVVADAYFVSIGGPASIGPGTSYKETASGAGQFVGFDSFGGFIAVPRGYNSGSPLSGSSTFTGQSFASLGITPGTYDFFYSFAGEIADRFTVQVGPVAVAAVPEPESIALLLAGLVPCAALARRRKKRSA